jgi:hypothetical protein
MPDSPALASTVTLNARETHADSDERIYQSLPRLSSPAYLSLLKTAPAAELPAQVLARAYRELAPSRAADVTLERLVAYNERYGYLDTVYLAARKRRSRLPSFDVDDLVHDTICEIVATLGGPRGENAVRVWTRYLQDCFFYAYRKLVGRRETRVEGRVDQTLEEIDMSYEQIDAIPWQGCVEPSLLEWLENYILRAVAQIRDTPVREIALDLFGHSPTPVSSNDPNEHNTLVVRFNVTRQTIYTWRAQARVFIRAALERQNEHDIDLSFLKPVAT